MNTSYISPADFVWEIELRSSDERALFVSTDKRPSTDSNSPFTDKPFSATTHHFEMPLVRCYTVPVMILDINFVITRPIYMIWYCIHMFWFLGGLSLHLNHLIAERASAPYRQFGTLPTGIFLSNLDSGQLETSLMTSYCHF